MALIFHNDDPSQEAYLTAQGLRRLANEEGIPVSIYQTEEDGGAPKLIVIPRKKK